MDDDGQEISEFKTNRRESSDNFNAENGMDRNERSDGSLFGRRKEDVAYRHRFFHTGCVCFSLLTLGCRNALIGPTLPDLRLIIDEDLSTASWIFTAKSIGGLIGALCAGVAYDRYNKLAVFVFAVCGMGVLTGVVPWCYHFAAMLIVHVINGVFATAVDAVVTADVAVVWKDKSGPFMQAVHCAFSVGGIIAPLICEPFLAEQVISPSRRANSSDYKIDGHNSSDQNVTGELSGYDNTTSLHVAYGETRIYIPYTILAFLCLLSGLLFVFNWFIYGNVYKKSLREYTGEHQEISNGQYFLSRKMKNVFTVISAISLLFYVVCENCFFGFLMTFAISELKWTKAQGSTATSAFWIAFAVGRLLGIVIVKVVSLTVSIVAFMTIATAGALLFLLGVIFSTDALIWVGVVTLGFGMSVIFGSVFSWLSKNVRTLTGKMTSVFFTCTCIGNMTVPLLVGYLMDKLSQMWFIYSCLIFLGIMCTCFLVILTLFSLLKKASTNKKEESISMK